MYLWLHPSVRLRESSPVRGLGRMGAMRGSSEDLLNIRSRPPHRGSLPYKKFSPVSASPSVLASCESQLLLRARPMRILIAPCKT